jgi:hypothetical protein
MARKKKPDKKKMHRLARILVGPVPSSKVIKAKVRREKPKHKKPIDPDDAGPA